MRLNDPLVPIDFGGWLRRVSGVFRRSFGKLAALAAVPAALTAAYLIAVTAATPGPEEMRRRFAEAGVTASGAVDPMAAFEIVFGRLLPIMLVFAVLMIVVGALYQGAAFFIAVRDANGQPSTAAGGVGFAGPRLLPFIGWSLLAGVVIVIATVVPMLPGMFLHVTALVVLGVIVSVLLGIFLGVIVFAALFGVVLIERAGIRRCVELVRGRFWASFGRLLVAGLIYLGYSILIDLVVKALSSVAGVTGLITTGSVIVALVQAALMIPALVYLVAVCLVTYAELRYREDRATTTRSLAAELAR